MTRSYKCINCCRSLMMPIRPQSSAIRTFTRSIALSKKRSRRVAGVVEGHPLLVASADLPAEKRVICRLSRRRAMVTKALLLSSRRSRASLLPSSTQEAFRTHLPCLDRRSLRLRRLAAQLNNSNLKTRMLPLRVITLVVRQDREASRDALS